MHVEYPLAHNPESGLAYFASHYTLLFPLTPPTPLKIGIGWSLNCSDCNPPPILDFIFSDQEHTIRLTACCADPRTKDRFVAGICTPTFEKPTGMSPM